MTNKKSLVDLELELCVMTVAAYGVSDGTEEGVKDANGKRRRKVFWLPKSLVECDAAGRQLQNGEQYTFTMPEWLAVDKGLV